MEDQSNYTIFRDCLSGPIVQKLLLNPAKKAVSIRAKGRKNSAAKADNAEMSSDANDQEAADDCADFVDVVISQLISPEDRPRPAYKLSNMLKNFYIST